MELVYYPDETLRKVADPIAAVDDEIRDLVPKMFEKMYATRGVGLAAPQVGVGRRLVVSNETGDPESKDLEEVYLNPEIVAQEGSLRGEEGCLSLPGIHVKVLRAQKVRVRYMDLDGETHEIEAEDWKARIFQHEIDHLDGILIIDKMSPAEMAFFEQDLKDLEAGERPEIEPSHSGAAL